MKLGLDLEKVVVVGLFVWRHDLSTGEQQHSAEKVGHFACSGRFAFVVTQFTTRDDEHENR